MKKKLNKIIIPLVGKPERHADDCQCIQCSTVPEIMSIFKKEIMNACDTARSEYKSNQIKGINRVESLLMGKVHN